VEALVEHPGHGAGAQALAPLRRLSRRAALAGGLLILASSALISADVLVRFFFGSVIFESFEISCYAFAVAVAFSLAFAAIERAHIRIDLLNARLRPRTQAWLNLIAAWCLAATAVALAWRGFGVFWSSLEIGARSRSILATPLALPQGLWSLGLIWFGIVTLALALYCTRQALQARWREINATIGPPAIADEIAAEGVVSVTPGSGPYAQ